MYMSMYGLYMALPYSIKTLNILAFLSECGSFKKSFCLESITHK